MNGLPDGRGPRRGALPGCGWMRVAMIAAVGVGALTALQVSAGPMVPRAKRELPADVQSLQGIRQFRLELEPLPEALTEAGLTDADVIQAVTTTLAAGGYVEIPPPDPGAPAPEVAATDEADDFDGAPTLWFKPRVLDDRPEPDPVAFVLLLEAHQTVHVPRLGRELFLPTYTLGAHEVAPRAELPAAARRQLRELAKGFARIVGRANHEP